jgi:hypothetical protein
MAKPSALDRGKVLAQSVDLADRRARGQQQLVEGDGVVERDLRVQRQVEHGRTAAGDEKEDQRVFAGLLEHGQRGAGRGEGVFVGQRVAALEVAKAPVALLGNWLEQQMPRIPLRRFMRSSRTSSMGPAAFAQRDHEDALVAGD